jgi:hypothetical protein
MESGPRLAMFPLSTVLFPHMPLPLHVFEPRYRALMADCLAGSGEFGVVLIERGSEVGGGDRRVAVGTVAAIEEAAPLSDGRWVLVARGSRRIRATEWLPDDPYPQAVVEELADAPSPGLAGALVGAAAAVRRARALLSELGAAPAVAAPPASAEDPVTAAWELCAQAPLTPFDAQRLLEVDDPAERLALLAGLCDAVADDVSRLLAGG